jgi:hypothetical protein
LALLRQAIAEDWYTQRLLLVIEGRRRVLEECQIFAVIDRIVAETPDSIEPSVRTLKSRLTVRVSSPWIALFQGLEKGYVLVRAELERD